MWGSVRHVFTSIPLCCTAGGGRGAGVHAEAGDDRRAAQHGVPGHGAAPVHRAVRRQVQAAAPLLLLTGSTHRMVCAMVAGRQMAQASFHEAHISRARQHRGNPEVVR